MREGEGAHSSRELVTCKGPETGVPEEQRASMAGEAGLGREHEQQIRAGELTSFAAWTAMAGSSF